MPPKPEKEPDQFGEILRLHNLNPELAKELTEQGFHIGYIKNSEGEIEYTIPLPHAKGKRNQLEDFAPAVPARITPTKRVAPTREFKRLFVFSDAQIDYRRLPDGSLRPIHDERALSVARMLCKDIRPDEIINLGDTVDLSALSRFAPDSDHFYRTLGPSFQRTHDMYAQFHADSPDANITEVDSNHNTRLRKFVLRYAPALYGVKQAGSAENDYPVMSYPFLANLGHLGVNWVSGYGSAEYVYGEEYDTPPIIFKHGEIVVSNGSTSARESARYPDANIVRGHCFDEQTQLLTKDGWKYRHQLSSSDQAVTYNLATDVLEYNEIESFHDYDNYTELYSIQGRRTDLLVTDKHGLIDFESGTPQLFDAQDFNSRSRRKMRTAGSMQRKGVDLSDDELRLIVWVAADGSLDNRYVSNRIHPSQKHVGGTKAIRFHFAKDRKIGRLSRLLDRLGIEYSLHVQNSGRTKMRFVANNTVIENYFNWGHKTLPPELRQANKTQAQVILNEYTHTDGNRNIDYPHAGQISTAKPEEADILHEIFVTNGIACNMTQRKSSDRDKSYILSFNENKTSTTHTGRGAKLVPYSGSVWCVTVKNHTLLVRRNGKTTITQNSHRAESFYRTTRAGDYLASIVVGTLCKTNGEVPSYHSAVDDLNMPVKTQENWQNGVLVIDDYDGRYSYDHILIHNGRANYNGKVYEAE